MLSGEDWLFRPALRKMCLYENIINGVLNLDDIATMNEVIDVDDENRAKLTRNS